MALPETVAMRILDDVICVFRETRNVAESRGFAGSCPIDYFSTFR
jgi:hypothetical protein